VCPEVSLHVEEAFRALGADARITFAADGTDLVSLARVTARGVAERIVAGGGDGTGRTPFLFVGNNEYAMERLTIGSRASLDRGRLSVYATSRLGRWGLVRLALRAWSGGLRQERDLLAFVTTDLFVETRRSRVRAALDGEVIVLRPPPHYAVRARALRVMTPAPGPTPGSEAVGTPRS
jgi:diacylglycerol kinase family enzyme